MRRGSRQAPAALLSVLVLLTALSAARAAQPTVTRTAPAASQLTAIQPAAQLTATQTTAQLTATQATAQPTAAQAAPAGPCPNTTDPPQDTAHAAQSAEPVAMHDAVLLGSTSRTRSLPWKWVLGTAAVTLLAGFALGWLTLDRRIRRKYGGLRIY